MVKIGLINDSAEVSDGLLVKRLLIIILKGIDPDSFVHNQKCCLKFDSDGFCDFVLNY